MPLPVEEMSLRSTGPTIRFKHHQDDDFTVPCVCRACLSAACKSDCFKTDFYDLHKPSWSRQHESYFLQPDRHQVNLALISENVVVYWGIELIE